MPNLFVPEEESLSPETEFFIATVSAYNPASGCQIILPGEAAATSKWYKTINGGADTGARVVVMKQSGTYIVLGPLSGEAIYYTDTIADIVTAATGITITDARFAQAGRTAQLSITFRPTTAITTAKNFKVGTLATGKTPPMSSPLIYYPDYLGYITGGGGIYVYGKATSTSGSYNLYATYILE